VKFVRGAELVTHAAPFHLEFLNSELARVGVDPLEKLCPQIIDTLQLAKAVRSDKKNSVKVLCKDLKIKKPKGNLFGTRLNVHLIASIYLALNC
jgi:DNA polymerase-3 subunit epsilon